MKSLNIDVIFPWEVGLVLVIMGLIFIIIGVSQSKKEIDDIDKIPFVKPTTKIFFGSVVMFWSQLEAI